MLAPFSQFHFHDIERHRHILAALGLGYYLGGSLADRKPSAAWFFSLIVIAGSRSCCCSS